MARICLIFFGLIILGLSAETADALLQSQVELIAGTLPWRTILVCSLPVMGILWRRRNGR